MPVSITRTDSRSSSRTTTSPGGLRLAVAAAPSRGGDHVPLAGPAILPTGPDGRSTRTRPDASVSRPRRTRRRENLRLLRQAAAYPERYRRVSRRRLVATPSAPRRVRQPKLGWLRGLCLGRHARPVPHRRRELRPDARPVLPGAAFSGTPPPSPSPHRQDRRRGLCTDGNELPGGGLHVRQAALCREGVEVLTCAR